MPDEQPVSLGEEVDFEADDPRVSLMPPDPVGLLAEAAGDPMVPEPWEAPSAAPPRPRVPPLRESPSVVGTAGPPSRLADAPIDRARSTGIGRVPASKSVGSSPEVLAPHPSGFRSTGANFRPKVDGAVTSPGSASDFASKSGVRRSFSPVRSSDSGATSFDAAAVVRATGSTGTQPNITGVAEVGAAPTSQFAALSVPSLPPPPAASAPSPVPSRLEVDEPGLGLSAGALQSHASPAPQPSPVPAPLGVFGKYRLIQHLAVGGMAQLYLAALDGPDGFSKQCVVKTVLPEFAALPDFNEMFINEAKVAALLHHPNIVQVYDFGREAGRYFLAMEYVRGASLQQILREASRAGQTLGPRFAVTIGAQMCDAMGYAHALKGPDGRPLNLVHRDLTTGNILISASGVAKLTDFGIVKSEINMSATAAGVVKGKYPYMSPEQIRAEPIDHRSDIFSLAVVLYEVATGTSLFRRRSLADTIAAVAHAQVRRPTEFVAGFPPQFERILLKALALERGDRFQSFAEFGQALDAFRLSRNWTASSRELGSLVQTLFPGGVAAGAYLGTASGLMPSPSDEGAPLAPESPSRVTMKPEEPPVPQVGAVEVALFVVALGMLSALVWLLLF